MQLSLWQGETGPVATGPRHGSAPSAGPALASRLRALGLPPIPWIATHRNSTVMLSWVPGRVLRLHEGYAHAPDQVLAAIVRFVTPGVRRSARLAARREFLGFPVDRYAPLTRPRESPEPERPGDSVVLERLTRLHAELNGRCFGGALAAVPIRLSARMRSRLGEVRLERRSGRVVYIALSRRHLRRDGWDGVIETLLHEMVHQWQAETGQAVDHGPEFRRKARELGIEPRAVRGPLESRGNR